MKKRLALCCVTTLVTALFSGITAYAGIFHYNISTQDVTIANLLEQNPNTTDPENLYVVAAIIVMAVIYMLIDKAKEKKNAKSGRIPQKG